jgi:hypothetical protein
MSPSEQARADARADAATLRTVAPAGADGVAFAAVPSLRGDR